MAMLAETPMGAVFDPATLARGRSMGQQDRQRFWSGTRAQTLLADSATAPGVGVGVGAANAKSSSQQQQQQQQQQQSKSGKLSQQQQPLSVQWQTPTVDKDIYTPFKSVSGRATPLDDQLRNNDYMPPPQDPRDRPPSRATSLLNSTGNYGRFERRTEGSVVYQPLTPANHASAWSNSLMFNKGYGDYAGQPTAHEAPLEPPPMPHMQTLPRQLPPHQSQTRPVLRNVSVHGYPPDEPTQPRQLTAQSAGQRPNGYVPSATGGLYGGQPSDIYQAAKAAEHKSNNHNGVHSYNSPLSGVDHQQSQSFGQQQQQPPMSSKSSKKQRRQKKANEQQQQQLQQHQSQRRSLVSLPAVEKVAVLHILLGACLFALGIARLLMLSIWGLGIELVYGVFVVLTGALGVIGCRRRHYCTLTASYVMSCLSCVLVIAPFVTGLLVTIPDSFRFVDPKLFTTPQEPYAVDILLSVICLLELIVAIVMSGLGCLTVGRAATLWHAASDTMPIKPGYQSQMSDQINVGKLAGDSAAMGPIFHTAVNVTHPSMM